MTNQNSSSLYRYRQQPLTPVMAAELILELLSGEIIETEKVRKIILDEHIQRGGKPPSGKTGIISCIKHALRYLKNQEQAINSSRNNWTILGGKNLPSSGLTTDFEKISDDLEEKFPVLIQDMVSDTNGDSSINDTLRPEVELGSGESCVYVFYLKTYKEFALMNNQKRWPCKIGKTDGDPTQRILAQVGTGLPEYPQFAVLLRTSKPSDWESSIHKILRIRNQDKTDAPGNEWFLASPEEIIDIIKIIDPSLFLKE